MLSQEQINEAVASSLPGILQGLREEITQSAIHKARDCVNTEISKAVTEFVKAEIIPAVQLELAAGKKSLVTFAPKLAADITEALSASLKAEITKKLESTWERKKIFESLIG